MFMQRLMTTLLLIPAVLVAIYFTNYWFFSALIFLLMIFCGWEWTQLIPLKQKSHQIIFLFALALAFIIGYFFYEYWLITGLVVWLFLAYAEMQYPKAQTLWARPWQIALLAFVLLPLFANSMMLIFLAPLGRANIVYFLFLVWAADIGAYLAGKLWGKHKLIPAVSPGKTVEGLFGGAVLTLLIATIGYKFFQVNIVCWYAAALTIFVIALIGDLSISLLKRRIHIKDTGHLIPGHGGVLDRLDSLIAAAPLFYCWLLIVGQ